MACVNKHSDIVLDNVCTIVPQQRYICTKCFSNRQNVPENLYVPVRKHFTPESLLIIKKTNMIITSLNFILRKISQYFRTRYNCYLLDNISFLYTTAICQTIFPSSIQLLLVRQYFLPLYNCYLLDNISFLYTTATCQTIFPSSIQLLLVGR